MPGDETKASKVFISYSQDSLDHKKRVLVLSDRLIKDGIHCNIDQYVDSPPEGWPRWMERQIQEADFVLIICTARYLRRVNGEEKPDVENGVRWESVIIYQGIYDSGTSNTKFIPILFEGANISDIPIPIKGASHYDLTTEADYEDLYRRLTDQPLIRRPKTGELRKLPPRDPIHDLLFSKPKLTAKKQQELSVEDSGSTSDNSQQTSLLEMQEKSQESSQSGVNILVPPNVKSTPRPALGQQSDVIRLVNECYNNIILAYSLTRDARKLFSRQKIYPDECARALSALKVVNKPIEELDKLVKQHPGFFGQTRSELVKTLHLMEVQLGDLEMDKNGLCPVCQDASVEQRQYIRQKLGEILKSLGKIKRSKAYFSEKHALDAESSI